MGVSVDVTSDNFTTEVVEASYERPVLVDFFAQWCGPCQMLKPILEKLVQEYDFILAKIDIDQNPAIANAYRIEGVPDVRIVSQGQMYQGFVGVLPEPKLRELLAQLNLKSNLEVSLEAAQQAAASGNVQQGKVLFQQLLTTYPQNPKITIAAAKFLIEQDELSEAERLLASVEEYDRQYYPQAEALGQLMQLKSDSQRPPQHELDQPFAQAVSRTLSGNYEEALQEFLAIVGKNRKYRDDGARKAMVMIFTLLGDEHPLTRQYRKQLTLTLF
ncbi:MAG: tetratricopeptide repeat protein [Elainellaceae cyanobacterium]